MKKIKLGYVPTRRSIFSAPDAIKYRGLTADRLTELGIDFVDITDINEEGLLYDDRDVEKIAEKFEKEGVDGLMLAHCNFGTEYVCARLANGSDFRYCFGDRWTSARNQTGSVFAIRSVVCSRPERCCGDSGCRLHT